jgi:CRP-like cAMP-binding protein
MAQTPRKEPSMAKPSSVRSASQPPPIAQDGDGNQIHNEILLSLPAQEYDSLLGKLEFMRLDPHHVVHEAGETMRSGYFCNSGMLSVLSVMPDGKSVEAGLIGKEGFSASPLVAGFRSSYTRTVVQAESTAFRVDAEVLRTAFRDSPYLERQVQRYSQILTMQVTQVATCNRLHDVVQRLARWLLMSQDRIGSPELPLTHDLLAQMLGTRRSSVTVAAGTLQQERAISYKRGHVTILSRRSLEKATCDCYALLLRNTKIWQGQYN